MNFLRFKLVRLAIAQRCPEEAQRALGFFYWVDVVLLVLSINSMKDTNSIAVAQDTQRARRLCLETGYSVVLRFQIACLGYSIHNQKEKVRVKDSLESIYNSSYSILQEFHIKVHDQTQLIASQSQIREHLSQVHIRQFLNGF